MQNATLGKYCNTVYTYYHDYDEESSGEHYEMIAHWGRSWANRGWNPKVLTRQDAVKHPLFKEIDDRLRRLPTVNVLEYELACYHRWLAVAAAGGGFMSDYDVVNYGFKPRRIQSDLTVYESAYGTNDTTPSTVGGTSYGFLSAVMAFVCLDVNEVTISHDGRPHTSDMVVIQKAAKRLNLVTVAPTVAQYGSEGWETAPLVHYAHSVTSNTDRLACLKHARMI